ncbi:MAG: Stk1 family PASTA domain-containing Ser/Thr kinase [Clostridiales bacterium]|nr:Stk1 family PASTA domain-containing Ser/Thr kinase [Clostridiales bacterium]
MSTRILAGRYELLERIGDGGMAVVYKARCKLLNRFVAIKILKPDYIKDVKFIENFRKESQAAASLSHPNIVGVYDVGREGSINYIVMELIEGKVLSDVIREEAPIDYMRAIEITKQLASALSLAHKNQIIHRDVKPLNILIAQDGTPKITDFGIAKAVNAVTLIGAEGTIMGSVHYFSPEQARGAYVDERSDIYSLGIVLYEMLTGRVPFDGDNPVNVALMHVNDEMVPPSKLAEGIPPRLEQIVMKATDKLQVNRFKSADEMLEALNNLEFVTSIVGDAAVGGIRRQVIAPQAQDRQADSGEDGKEDGGEKETGEKEATGKMGKKDKKGKPKVKFNKLKLLAVVLALLCGVPASILLASFIAGGGAEEVQEILVPYVVGLSYDRAKEELNDLGLDIQVGDEVISSEYEEGKVVSQDPQFETSVKEGMIVTVNISKGTRAGTVPKITGIPYEDALFMIQKYGFQAGPKVTRKDSAPKGIVISQTPEAGEEAKPGTTINYVVSEGKAEEETMMPALVGKDMEEAKEELEKAGLKLGEPEFEKSEEHEKDIVMWQQYPAGNALAKGATVKLKVSAGNEPEEPSEPVSVSLEINYSDFVDNQVFFLTVTVSDEDGARNLFTEQQRIKDNMGETVTFTGKGTGTVTVIIDGQAVIKRNVNFDTGEID